MGKFADSGSSKLSICSGATGSWLLTLRVEVRLLGELSFIREAGVAGDGMPGSCTPGTLCSGPVRGDGLADLGFGTGGGGMSMLMSFKFSGDTELLLSESVSRPADEEEVDIAGTGSC